MKEFALALCGGGGKGAYQIGLWKAFNECNISRTIKAVSGTSVGALNAVLFAIGDFENAKKIWYSIDRSTLLSPSAKNSFAWCSRDGLRELLKSVSLVKLRKSIPVYVNITDKSTLNVRNVVNSEVRIETVLLNRLPVNDMIEVLLATSAIPVVYDEVKIKDRKYIDGGVLQSGNTPIEPLYRHGYRNIVISSLDSNFSIYNISDSFGRQIDVKHNYPHADFIIFQPLESLGNIFDGTLDFSKTGIRSRMIDGYKDTMKRLRGDEIYFMKNDYSKINIILKDKMEKMFRSEKELELFIKVTNFSNPNIETSTMEGKIWYVNIAELFGWRLQQHKVIPSHYRIIDPDGIRKAWVLNPENLLRALENYEAVKKFR